MQRAIRSAGFVAAVGMTVGLLAPSGARAQAGALGAGSALGAPGENAHTGAPVFTESGLTLGEGIFAASAVAGYTSGDVGLEETIGFSVFQLIGSAFYGVSEELTIGAILPVVNSVSIDDSDESESGIGDLNAYAKWAFLESSDGRTNVALIGQASLPTGENGFGAEGVVIGAGIGASREGDGASIHGSALLVLPTDDFDGDPFVNLTGAGVWGLGEAIGISAEGRLSIGDETFFSAGPAVRFRASENVFIDGGVIFPLVTPDDQFAESDYAIFAAVNVGG